MLRLLLPPNLAAAAPRDAVALKVELTPGADPAPEILPALALLQRWVGPAAQPPFFLQLTRAQLRELLAALRGQPVFALVSRPDVPLPWIGPLLRGVSEHLNEPAAPAPTLATVASISSPSRCRPGSTPPMPPRWSC